MEATPSAKRPFRGKQRQRRTHRAGFYDRRAVQKIADGSKRLIRTDENRRVSVIFTLS
jgi:hypothetical protein